MALFRYASATLVEPNINSEAWQKNVCCGHKAKCACGTGSCRTKVARTILAKYAPEKYLLSHATIIASVDVDEARESKSDYKDYLIKPAFSKLVNNNGDAWTKSIVASTYRTFIGANNYQEHVQIPELSKGKVIDAVLREVPVGKDDKGKELTSYYVDILVATDRKHKDLVRKIEAKEVSHMSMGCKIAFSVCTKCGKKAVDETEACDHVRYEKNSFFYDENSVQRKVAELCGHASDPESVVFMDASWVANPAFTGAVVRNVVNPPEDVMAKIKEAEKKEPYEYKDLDFLKAASKMAADPPVEETPAAPLAEPPKEEAPAEGDTPAAPKEDAPEAPADQPAADQPMDQPVDQPPPQTEEPTENVIKKFKQQIKEKLLKQLSDEITKDFSEEEGEEEGRPKELETLDENLIQPTASTALKQMHVMKRNWDAFLKKTAGHLDEKSFYRLKFGTYMLLMGNDMTALKEYGYNRRDFLAVLSSLDSCFKRPLSLEIKKALANLNGTKGLAADKIAFALQKLAGRKLSSAEMEKALVWLKLMDAYPE